jgi:hypothetical protein
MEVQETTVGKPQNQDVGVAASIGETERRLKAYCDALGNLGGEPRPQILPFRQGDGVSEDQDGQKREGRSGNASIANTLAASCYKGVGNDGMTLIRQKEIVVDMQNSTVMAKDAVGTLQGEGMARQNRGFCILTKDGDNNEQLITKAVRSGGRGSLDGKHSWDVIQAAPEIIQVNNPTHSVNRIYADEGISPSLRASNRQEDMGGANPPKIVVEGNLKGDKGHICHNVYNIEGVAPTFRENHNKITKILQHVRNAEGETTHYNVNDIAGTLKQSSGNQQNFVLEQDEPKGVAYRTHNYRDEPGHIIEREDTISNQLTTVPKDSMLLQNTRIRRLTPMECERLQSFPDDWTKYRMENGVIKEVADTHRYRQLGNAVTTFVISAIGVALAQEIPLKNPPASAP